MFKLCSRLEGQLLAVPTSRYSYPGMGFGDTFADCTPCSGTEGGVLLLGIGESRYCPIRWAGVPPGIPVDTVFDYLKQPFRVSNIVCGEVVGFIPALKHGAFFLNLRKRPLVRRDRPVRVPSSTALTPPSGDTARGNAGYLLVAPVTGERHDALHAFRRMLATARARGTGNGDSRESRRL